MEIKKSSRTFIFFESPRRLLESLEELSQIVTDDRQIVIARELTKTYEEIIRGNLAEIIQWAKKDVLGEITVVVDRAPVASNFDLTEATKAVFQLIDQGVSHKDAVSQVANEEGLAKRALYEATLELMHERE
jgi:16S rRNA (cytidine1402-2'-O)-methyltransferase